nr:GxxExxY protein [Hymenobacter piscis]
MVAAASIFWGEKVVLAEPKALSDSIPAHHAQVLDYLNAYQLEVAQLLNFSAPRLTYNRFVGSPRPT